ncbi:MAG: hypothetical protein A3J28_12785 [Acidobacteria bacterium RIFCSPLOWO2_12_FULL_60_22]|nr:MAG: hypothetical protein A3J28_12785 [Acidobacteria bacterium RIFCSPLOWO2_12_FULL_60_22]
MKRAAIRLGLVVILAAAESYGQERRVYEGVVDLKQKTIGTVVLLEIAEGSLKGWVGGNRYEIDERKGKISYSGPDGEGSRFVQRLERLSGRFEELSEESGFSGVNIAAIEVRGRRRDLRVGRPALWKQDGPPFETFERIEEMLGKEIAVWVAGSNERTGRVVAVEEPEGMNIPLKAPKKPKETQPKKPTR